MGTFNIGADLLKATLETGEEVVGKTAKQAIKKTVNNQSAARTIKKAAAKDPIWKKTGEALNATGKYNFNLEDIDTNLDKDLLIRLNQKNHITGKSDFNAFAESYDQGTFRAQKAMIEGQQAKTVAQQRVNNMQDPREGIEQIQRQLRDEAYWADQNSRVEAIKQQVAEEASIAPNKKSLQDKLQTAKEKRANAPQKEKRRLKTLDEALEEEKLRKENLYKETDLYDIDEAYDDLGYQQTSEAKTGTELKTEANELIKKEREAQRKTFVEQQRKFQENNNWRGPEITGEIPAPTQPTYFPPIEAVETTKDVFNVRTGKKTTKVVESHIPYDFQDPKFGQRSKNQFFNRSWAEAATGKDITTAGSEATGIGVKHAVGAIVAAGGLMTLFSSTGGQQNNAQLYGQQPLY